MNKRGDKEEEEGGRVDREVSVEITDEGKREEKLMRRKEHEGRKRRGGEGERDKIVAGEVIPLLCRTRRKGNARKGGERRGSLVGKNKWKQN